MNKLLLIGIGIVGLSVASVQAEEKAAAVAVPEAPKVEKKAQAPKPKVELKDMTVVGTIQKVELKKKDGTIVYAYKLVGENGTEYNLRASSKKDAPGSNLADLVGAKVKVVGKGSEGKRNVIPVITSVEKVDQAPAAK